MNRNKENYDSEIEELKKLYNSLLKHKYTKVECIKKWNNVFNLDSEIFIDDIILTIFDYIEGSEHKVGDIHFKLRTHYYKNDIKIEHIMLQNFKHFNKFFKLKTMNTNKIKYLYYETRIDTGSNAIPKRIQNINALYLKPKTNSSGVWRCTSITEKFGFSEPSYFTINQNWIDLEKWKI